ncbi:hypothetical protein LOZ58_004196 [Ophidiomyces ophidiicola]|nr:hypothetical protein LOZ58_004196 [Ophidiomyces ophidiicola]
MNSQSTSKLPPPKPSPSVGDPTPAGFTTGHDDPTKNVPAAREHKDATSKPHNAGGDGAETVADPDTMERKGKVSGLAAGIHGAGEVLRGKAGEVVERAANNEAGAEKAERIQREGWEELDTGRFSQATRERELGDPSAGRHKHY